MPFHEPSLPQACLVDSGETPDAGYSFPVFSCEVTYPFEKFIDNDYRFKNEPMILNQMGGVTRGRTGTSTIESYIYTSAPRKGYDIRTNENIRFVEMVRGGTPYQCYIESSGGGLLNGIAKMQDNIFYHHRPGAYLVSENVAKQIADLMEKDEIPNNIFGVPMI